MAFWTKVKKDVEREIKGGIAVLKEKTHEFTEEGKKRYQAFNLKSRVQKEMAELGASVYELRSKLKNPMSDKRVKAAMDKIKALEEKIAKLEKPAKKAVKKAVKSARKTVKSARSTAKKTAKKIEKKIAKTVGSKTVRKAVRKITAKAKK